MFGVSGVVAVKAATGKGSGENFSRFSRNFFFFLANLPGAAATVRRAERQAAVERFCGVANRCALAVGLLLVVEFPFACAALESMRESTAAYCAALAAAEVDAVGDAFAANGETTL